jgi:hypothetical protein
MVPTKFSLMGLHLRCQRFWRGSLCRIPYGYYGGVGYQDKVFVA